MEQETKALLAQAEARLARIARAADDQAGDSSRQPRFHTQIDAKDFFRVFQRWAKDADMEAPAYRQDSRLRDQWLRKFWRRQPHISGIINSINLVDANRGWTLTGGRNQVYRYSALLHRADGVNWRYYARRASLSHWVTDLGSITESARTIEGGPLADIYHVDSARCKMTGNVETPLLYSPKGGKDQHWRPEDFFRTTSLPSDDETYNGLGYGFISRGLDLVKLMVAVVEHDLEMAGARMPRGILFLQNVTEVQWDEAMDGRDEDARTTERRYFGGVMVIATEGMESPDAKLVAISQLPQNFDLDTFMDQMMYGLALCAGYGVDEFWPINRGVLGRGNEAETQERRSSTKGVSDFAKAHEEALQKELPGALEFGYVERDLEGDLREAEVAQAWAEVSTTLYEAGLTEGAPMFSREEARSIMSTNSSIVPPEWTEFDELTHLEDDQKRMRRLRDAMLQRPRVRLAIERFPDEPIVRYYYPSGRMTTIWERGDLAMRRSSWAGAQLRQGDDESEILYQDDLVTITEADVESAIGKGRRRVGSTFGDMLEAETLET